MNIEKVKKHIIDNPELIEEILEKAGFSKVKDFGAEYRFSFDDDGSGSANVVKKDNLYFTSFSRNLQGDLFTCLMLKLNYTFPQSVKWACSELGIEVAKDEPTSNKRLPFGGFWKKYKNIGRYNDRDDEDEDTPIYDNTELDRFKNASSSSFIIDGISAQTQELYRIGFDVDSNRITIPWFDTANRLIGVMGRSNWKDSEKDTKYLPIIKFKKSMFVYSYNESYDMIKKHNRCLIGESEKFSMQLHSMGLGIGISLGGNKINNTRANIIKGLSASEYILVLDEGLPEGHIREQASRIKISNCFFKNKVGYVYDRDNKYIPKGSKKNAVDMGEDILNKVIAECVVWI